VSETIEVVAGAEPARRIRRTAEEKLRVVEATLRPGARIARVAREHGVTANQVFQWRYAFRKGTLAVHRKTKAKLLPVTLAAERGESIAPGLASPARSSGSSRIALPGRAGMGIESGVEASLFEQCWRVWSGDRASETNKDMGGGPVLPICGALSGSYYAGQNGAGASAFLRTYLYLSREAWSSGQAFVAGWRRTVFVSEEQIPVAATLREALSGGRRPWGMSWAKFLC
jgi:transposase-like protein